MRKPRFSRRNGVLCFLGEIYGLRTCIYVDFIALNTVFSMKKWGQHPIYHLIFFGLSSFKGCEWICGA
jgi:hypothetical protein